MNTRTTLSALAFALAAGVGCGSSPDDRPATFEVISLEILAPSCGQVACHSTTTEVRGYAFDTLAGSRLALQDLVLGHGSGSGGGSGHGGGHQNLMQVLTASDGKRMPPDWPLEAQDIALIQTWITAGAPGL